MGTRQLPSGTVTLLFTDIEGSTRLLQELGREAYVRVLTEHRRLLRDAFARHGGVEVEMQGDSFHFAFTYARDAVAAALAGQQALQEHDWESHPIRVRMGIHSGEPVQSDGLYAGIDVHRAARVMSAAYGGQILLTESTARLAESELPPGVEIVGLGAYQLKDLRGPTRLYQLGAGDFPRPRTQSRTKLPTRPIPLIGRVAGHEEVRGMITAPRLVTVVVAALLASAVAAVLVTRGAEDAPSPSEPVAVGPNSIAVIDPATDRVVAGIAVGNGPTRIAVAGGKVWVLNRDDQTISLIDASAKALVKTFGVGVPPVGLAADANSVWIGSIGKRRPTDIEDAARAPGAVVELDATSRHVDRTIDAPPLPAPPARTADMGPLALGSGAIWYLSGNQTVSRISRDSATVVARFRYSGSGLGVSQPSIAVGEGGIWVSAVDGASGGALTRIDPRTNALEATVQVPAAGPVVAGLGGVWVADQWYASESVWKVDPSSNRVVGSIRVGPLPFGIAVGAGAVWATSTDGTVSRIDPVSRSVTRKIRVGGTPSGVAVGAGLVWVAVS